MDRDRIFRGFIFLAWASLTLWLNVHHELWRDEVDSWLLARDASWHEMFSILPDKGQPPLWYLLLKGAVALGQDWRAMQAINLVAVWGAGWLLVFNSSFPLLVILPVLFSFLFSYEYPAIARNYGLGIFGLLLYADLETRPRAQGLGLLAVAQCLMCWSTVHFLALALVLFAFRGFGRIKQIRQSPIRFMKAELPFILFFLTAVAVLWPTGRGQLAGASVWENFKLLNFRDSITHSLLPFEVAGWPTMLLVLACYGLMMLASSRPLATLALFVAGVGSLEVIFCFKYYSGAPRHSGLIFVWLCASLWLTAPNLKVTTFRTFFRNRNALVPIVFWMLFAWNIPVTVDVWRLETRSNFSDAVAAAPIFRLNEIRSRDIVCWAPLNCSAILAYLPYKTAFWSPYFARRQTFNRWDREAKEVHEKSLHMNDSVMAEVLAATIPHFSAWGAVNGPVFMSMWPVKNPELHGLRLLVHAPKTAWRILDESFWIYGPLADDGLATALKSSLSLRGDESRQGGSAHDSQQVGDQGVTVGE